MSQSTPVLCAAPGMGTRRAGAGDASAEPKRRGTRMSSVVKKRKKKMRKHKHRKMLKKTRWQRKHKG
jgi:hypothetical protein